MSAKSWLLDTNILLRWVMPENPEYPLVNATIKRLIAENSVLYYTSQNLAEFWNTCTRPLDRNGYGLSPRQTDVRARPIEDTLELLPDGPKVHHQWRSLILTHEVSGVQVHDARLVASMRVHRVGHLLTFNQRDFRRYQEIEAVHPGDLLTKTS